MEYILAMIFLTEEGKKNTFSISGVKPGITKDEIDALMDLILAKNIFETSSGSLVKKSSAQLTERKVTKFEVKAA